MVLSISVSKLNFPDNFNRIKVSVHKASQPKALCTSQKANRIIHFLDIIDIIIFFDDDDDGACFPSPEVEMNQSLIQVLLFPPRAEALQVLLAFSSMLSLHIFLPSMKLLRGRGCFLQLWFSSDAPWCFLLLWIPQGHLHIAQVPQGEQVQITQDSEVSKAPAGAESWEKRTKYALEPAAFCLWVGVGFFSVIIIYISFIILISFSPPSPAWTAQGVLIVAGGWWSLEI